MVKKVVKRKTPYIGNGIRFVFFAFLTRPVLACWKINTRILMNNQLNTDVQYYSCELLSPQLVVTDSLWQMMTVKQSLKCIL